jgi:hypothetical protein
MMSHIRIIIGLLAIAALMLSLTNYAEAQTIPIPEFAPKAPEVQDDGSSQTQQPKAEPEPEPPRPTDFAMKVQLEPHENEFLEEDGWYQVSDFALTISNSSELCPTGSCELERSLTGKLNVNIGDSTRIMDLNTFWKTVEEREQDGVTVQIVEGTLDASRDPVNPEYQSQINGTLTPDGNDLILEAHGTAGSPYTYLE